MSKKVVIVSYSTYPNNSPRSNRTKELSEELARQGADVTLYVLDGGYDYTEYCYETKVKVRSLGKTYLHNFDYKKGGFNQNLILKIITRALGRHLEFPMIELIINTYKVLVKESKIDLLITIAIPYPIHWGAALLRTINKEKLRDTTWAADCGDPYMGNDFYRKPSYFKYIENWFCTKTDYIIVPTENSKKGYYKQFENKIKVIPQGFKFNNIKPIAEFRENKTITFIYAGTFYKELRDPRPFINYLNSLDIDFRFIIYTKNKLLIQDQVKESNGRVEVYDYIPRLKLIKEMSKADFLVNFDNPTSKQSPSKLIDYSLSNRPILSINSIEPLDINIIEEFLNKNYSNQTLVEDIQKYNIENIAKSFLNIS